ncbi:hypothetical protein M436DRAFT_64129 [Aureobasidium namibiae CBS 147.97]|uniref:Uncharacterized protein n=1 Tax=Aureobasidium namibiae CBS 147.97 TaxID=1043004 RepID=A0A074WIS8_9PEZI|nr:uncharacterized protein M436DRAFT_64129 [Aureobasidium namibiae CBS 147.97]KEQ72963.1 hypothetical protein M436DRAFT_64129 [Aureobasidium namibiae CBS 147.97]
MFASSLECYQHAPISGVVQSIRIVKRRSRRRRSGSTPKCMLLLGRLLNDGRSSERPTAVDHDFDAVLDSVCGPLETPSTPTSMQTAVLLRYRLLDDVILKPCVTNVRQSRSRAKQPLLALAGKRLSKYPTVVWPSEEVRPSVDFLYARQLSPSSHNDAG